MIQIKPSLVALAVGGLVTLASVAIVYAVYDARGIMKEKLETPAAEPVLVDPITEEVAAVPVATPTATPTPTPTAKLTPAPVPVPTPEK